MGLIRFIRVWRKPNYQRFNNLLTLEVRKFNINFVSLLCNKKDKVV